MSEVVTSIDIAAPPEEVWDVVMDPTRLGRLGDDPPQARQSLGTDRMEQVLCIHHVNFHVKWELASSDRPRHAEWKGRGPGALEGRDRVHADGVDGGTHFEYRNEFKAPLGPLGAAASRALVGGVPEREANASLQKLKALLEKGKPLPLRLMADFLEDKKRETAQQWICTSCGFIYDPADGDPDGGIAPGTAFEDVPDDSLCPVCGARKRDLSPTKTKGTSAHGAHGRDR